MVSGCCAEDMPLTSSLVWLPRLRNLRPGSSPRPPMPIGATQAQCLPLACFLEVSAWIVSPGYLLVVISKRHWEQTFFGDHAKLV